MLQEKFQPVKHMLMIAGIFLGACSTRISTPAPDVTAVPWSPSCLTPTEIPNPYNQREVLKLTEWQQWDGHMKRYSSADGFDFYLEIVDGVLHEYGKAPGEQEPLYDLYEEDITNLGGKMFAIRFQRLNLSGDPVDPTDDYIYSGPMLISACVTNGQLTYMINDEHINYETVGPDIAPGDPFDRQQNGF